jgi:hypothetical protein
MRRRIVAHGNCIKFPFAMGPTDEGWDDQLTDKAGVLY